jgi:hypothetical protein
MALDYEVLLSNGDVIKFENATIEIKGTAVLVIACLGEVAAAFNPTQWCFCHEIETPVDPSDGR